MKVLCLDTNAILDICYRFYPQSIFGNLWQALDAAVLARQIKFVITRHIYDEIIAQITRMGYDDTIFNDFLTNFGVQIIDDYALELSQLKASLMTNTTIAPHKLGNLDNDLSNICVSKKYGYTVLTSEQGFRSNIATATNIRNLKIPDICHHYQVACGDWLTVFHTIGFHS